MRRRRGARGRPPRDDGAAREAVDDGTLTQADLELTLAQSPPAFCTAHVRPEFRRTR